MKLVIVLMLIPIGIWGQARIYHKDGGSVEGKILEANGTHVTFQRAEDHQQFRFKISDLALNSQQAVELYHSVERYSNIPKVQTPLDNKTLSSYTGYIDRLILTSLKSKRVFPTKPVDDDVYVRRLYLTLIGRIPTYNELTDFLNDRNPNKKAQLVQTLLNSEGYVNHQTNWWTDMLRVKDRVQGTNVNVGGIYREWLRQALRDNKPYDEIVRELLSSTGELYGGGETTSYYLRDRGMQEDNLSHTIRVFLGTRLQCAMCHNHPFDRWTQKEFYELTAFTSGIGQVRVNSRNKVVGQLNKIIRDTASPNSGIYNNWRNQVRDSLSIGLESNGTGEIKLPKDFAEDDGEPGDRVYAKAIFTPKPVFDPTGKDPQSRLIFADWVTSEDNPRFTTMIANRLWKHVFGAGLIEPIDAMMDDTLASNPVLMKYLERLMVSVDYDMKEYIRILVSTKLFQRQSIKEDFKSLEEYTFAGPMVRRMTGEQLWDSLVTLVYNDIDETSRIYLHNQQDYSVIYERYKDMTAEEIYADFEQLAKDYNPEGRIPGNRNLLQVVQKIINQTAPDKPIRDRTLVRSSYLQSPPPGGHLIRQFGGSDKEQIDNSNSEPNTTQVLNLLNGFVERNILANKGADFIESMKDEKSKAKQVENVFLSILGRKPSTRELNDLKGFLEEGDNNSYKHVAWILLNTHEFIFIK
jgi:hypothetical protein